MCAITWLWSTKQPHVVGLLWAREVLLDVVKLGNSRRSRHCPQSVSLSVSPFWPRGASAAVVVYDQTNAVTFERAQEWVRQAERESETCDFKCWNGLDIPMVDTPLSSYQEIKTSHSLTPQRWFFLLF